MPERKFDDSKRGFKRMAEMTPVERARATRQVVHSRMERFKQAALANAMGVAESEISELKKRVERMMQMFAVLGLKVVDIKAATLDPAAFAFLLTSHQRSMRKFPAEDLFHMEMEDGDVSDPTDSGMGEL